ncbi:MAG: immune inhibitor A [Bacteroidetes bacterium]|nr:immune inhibitor A [Bacteroidota bacterium]
MSLFKLITGAVAGIVISATSITAQTEQYSRVKIYADDNGLKRLAEAGVGFDHGEYKRGQYFISDFSASDISIFKSLGAKYEILINDVSQYYVQQNISSATQKVSGGVASNACGKISDFQTPVNFKLGSMGGFYTYAELLANLDTMAAKFPSVFKAKTAIGSATTVGGRSLYYVKISDNPNVDESEPELLYTALHHAREPASASQVIMYMYYLLENYNTNPEVKFLVDNTEMYFVPCINPDGYIHNQTTNPNGGGMWRKNRRNNGDGTYGVDLNRNYGQSWGYDNSGSSGNTNSDTYRGASAFSEAETQIIKQFCESRQFKLALNYHTYSNLLIYPWGYKSDFFTPDSTVYKAYAKEITRENNYRYGTPNQTVAYVANGSSDDWMYGEQGTKAKILAMTPEAGAVNDGFWPAQNRIVDICKENIAQNLHFAELAVKYAVVRQQSPKIVSKLSNYLVYDIQRLGLDSPATYTVTLTPVTSNIISAGSPKSYSTLKRIEQRTDSISYSLITGVTDGDKLIFVLSVNNGSYIIRDTITKIYGMPVTTYATDAGSLVDWTSPGWGTSTSVYHSAPSSITDSPIGNYPDGTMQNYWVSSIEQSKTVNLTDAVYAEMTFWARWAIEANYDYVEVNASSDGGANWSPLCGKHTIPGNIAQDPNNPVYDGYQYTWVKESIDLSDYIGQNILIRFTLVADPGTNYDGFYFDDLDIVKIVPKPLGVNMAAQINSFIAVQIYPNPVNESAKVNFMLPQNVAAANLVLYDALGRMVDDKQLLADQSGVTISTQRLSPGVYYYQLVAGGQYSEMKKMVVVR